MIKYFSKIFVTIKGDNGNTEDKDGILQNVSSLIHNQKVQLVYRHQYQNKRISYHKKRIVRVQLIQHQNINCPKYNRTTY